MKLLAALTFLVSLIGSLSACTLLPAPVTPTPTATPSPSSTPEPTLTPFVLPTFPVVSPMPTYDLASPGALECRVRSQSVANGTSFRGKERFEMAWKVKNTGAALWEPAAIQFVYYSGARLHVSPVGDFGDSVDPGNTTTLMADMIAPKSSGKYATTWTLRYGAIDFCRVTLTISVR